MRSQSRCAAAGVSDSALALPIGGALVRSGDSRGALTAPFRGPFSFLSRFGEGVRAGKAWFAPIRRLGRLGRFCHVLRAIRFSPVGEHPRKAVRPFLVRFRAVLVL